MRINLKSILMNKKTKRLINSIANGFFSLLFFFLAYIGYKKSNIDLSKQNKLESIILNKGIDIHHGSIGKKSNVFFISLKNLDENLGIYRMSKNYNDLLQKINIGDKVKVYYQSNSNKSENINIDLIQLEKNGKIIIDKREYEEKESFLFYIGLIAGFLILYLSYRNYKR